MLKRVATTAVQSRPGRLFQGSQPKPCEKTCQVSLLLDQAKLDNNNWSIWCPSACMCHPVEKPKTSKWTEDSGAVISYCRGKKGGEVGEPFARSQNHTQPQLQQKLLPKATSSKFLSDWKNIGHPSFVQGKIKLRWFHGVLCQ